ncbi:hypothetical protein PGT21_033976 [Puccinia graminis f. sp. tritici]|uniref:Uncharacterized protein n=1 Tax=Puccinia graminis f. sp. tritici TaxID=56615 RepID=A0A5B0P4U7_PUCGR|nr:hypothetical protein PGT21_033976 [Puccinia graminis f. sp. tritici]
MLMPVGVHILFLVGLIFGLLGAVGTFGFWGIVDLLGLLVVEIVFGLLAYDGIMAIRHFLKRLKSLAR